MKIRSGLTVAAVMVGVATLVGIMWLDQPRTTSAGPVTPGPAAPSRVPTGGAPDPSNPPSMTTMHYVSNTGAHIGPVAKLGFDLFDVGPDAARIDALGPGQQALVWLGNLDNTSCTPGFSWSAFTAAVDRLGHDPNVFGYYLSDEPHPSICPRALSDIRARADYIRTHAPGQKSFIVLMDASRLCGSDPGCEYRELNPALSHVDLIGIDPFPCHIDGGCAPERIDLEVQRAIAAGIPVQSIVPVFQVFGQSCSAKADKYYQLPSAAELTGMLADWGAVVPDPVFDYAYTWRSSGPACPSLDRATGLQAAIRAHNAE